MQDQKRVDVVMETSVSAITIVDAAGAIIYANPAAEALYGLTRDSLTRRGYNDPEWHITALDGGPMPDEDLPFRRVMATGEAVHDIRHAIVWPDGRRRFLSINGAPFAWEGDRLREMVFSVQDITHTLEQARSRSAGEAFYRGLLDDHPFPVVHYGPDTGILFCNRVTLEFFGLELGDVLGRRWSDMLSDAAAMEDARAALARLEPDAATVVLEQQHRDAEGRLRTVRWTNRGFFDAEGRLVRVQGVGEDITDHLHARRERERSEVRFRRLFETTPDGLILVDENRTIVEANPGVRTLLGYEPSDLVGTSVETLVPADFREHHAALAEHFMVQPGERAHMMAMMRQVSAVRADGQRQPVAIMLKKMELGGATMVLTIIRDREELENRNIELLEISQKLQREARRAEEASAAKTQFLATVSHELRTPLNAILGFADLLDKGQYGALSDEQREVMDIVLTQARHLLSLINSIVDVAGLSRAKGPPVAQVEIDLAALLQDIVRAYRMQPDARHHRFASRLPSEPVTVYADPTGVAQIVNNLLSNAVKFSRDGSTVTVGLERGEQFHAIAITDEGQGMAREQVRQATAPFWRGANVLQSQEQGLGLGLTLAKGLAEAQGGRLDIESVRGHGTTMRVYLPVSAADVCDEDADFI
ncbi:sensor histidine kinase [Yunchengibacter salinarum]|uniref:sensor histidine kinase n=1 Tax=Yunchengibacter salinarum TaxID=3133399 RepID=UPI0035B66313